MLRLPSARDRSSTFWPLNSGRYFSTGSSTFTLPSSTRIIRAVAVIGLDCEAIQNRASVVIGRLAAMSARPTASRLRTLSLSATAVTAPASEWLSTNGCSAAAAVGTVAVAESSAARSEAVEIETSSNARRSATENASVHRKVSCVWRGKEGFAEDGRGRCFRRNVLVRRSASCRCRASASTRGWSANYRRRPCREQTRVG